MVSSLKDMKIVQIYAGGEQSYAITKEGKIFYCGNFKNRENTFVLDKDSDQSDNESNKKKRSKKKNYIVYDAREYKFPFNFDQTEQKINVVVDQY